jgi:hypothetical protein
MIRAYLAKVFDGMAKGLFASLIIGTIIQQIGVQTGITWITDIGFAARFMMGPAIGAGVAFRRNAKVFTLLAAVAAGFLGAGGINFALNTATTATISIGNPVGALIAAVAAVEIAKFVEGKTKFDLLIVPAVVVFIGGLVGLYVTPPIDSALVQFGNFLNHITNLQPIIMGILLSLIIGLTLTLPIVSSAALCIIMRIGIGDDGDIGTIAAGAALAGCCAQMVGFAVMSFRENGFSGLISQGLGTSMIQFPNIIKNPWVWLPPTFASIITGPLSTVVFRMKTDSVGAGMGTSGLVGPFTTFAVMESGWFTVMAVATVHFIAPAAISLGICELMRKKGLIKFGDLRV